MTAGRRSADPRKASSAITEAITSWDPQPAAVDAGSDDASSAADLYGIRLKMEEKRKRIEAEKRQAELVANRQREKVGKAAFLQVTTLALEKCALSSWGTVSCVGSTLCDVARV